MNSQPAPLVISAHDARRLEALLASPTGKASPMAEPLEAELLRAELREPGDMPADVVTMNSQVVCVDELTGAERTIRLVYPADADVERGHVSVLAPVGAALLGLSVGSAIDWPLPSGRSTRLRVDKVLYQPEAQGRLD
jgi:regulator of nucleoside diphosphate kinase